MRKIDLMYAKFGRGEGFCGECGNFARIDHHGKIYRKCAVYGVTASEASDWKVSYPACGMKNSLWTGRDIIECVTPDRPAREELNGQTVLFGKDIPHVVIDESTCILGADIAIEPDITYCAGEYLRKG